jgi:cobalt transporter subunit CbtA
MHNNTVANGLLSGAVAAIVAAVLHLMFLQPILLRAEEYESGARIHSFEAAAAHDEAADDHAAAAASPAGEAAVPSRFDVAVDLSRDGQTVLFFLVTYAGFGLLLAGVVDLAKGRGYVPANGHAALWGAAGFAVFSLVPSFGLAPEPPGLAAGEIVARQMWWIAVATITAATLAAVAFNPARLLWGSLGCAALVALMFMVPHPAVLTGLVPPELVGVFAARSLGISAVAWLILALGVLRTQKVAASRLSA